MCGTGSADAMRFPISVKRSFRNFEMNFNPQQLRVIMLISLGFIDSMAAGFSWLCNTATYGRKIPDCKLDGMLEGILEEYRKQRHSRKRRTRMYIRAYIAAIVAFGTSINAKKVLRGFYDVGSLKCSDVATSLSFPR